MRQPDVKWEAVKNRGWRLDYGAAAPQGRVLSGQMAESRCWTDSGKSGKRGAHMSLKCIGIDIGGTTVKCGLFNVDGEVLDKWEIKTRTENNGENIIADIAETMNAKIAEKGLDKEEIVGAGVGVPGPADEEGNVPVAVNLHWGFVPLSKELSEKTGLAVRVGNDANVAALGEMWKGGAVGYHNVVMVTLGTGVGGGIIINGKIVTGSNGAGGEIGHIHVTDSVDKPCNCGNTGCLEQVASATGVVYLANKKLAPLPFCVTEKSVQKASLMP